MVELIEILFIGDFLMFVVCLILQLLQLLKNKNTYSFTPADWSPIGNGSLGMIEGNNCSHYLYTARNLSLFCSICVKCVKCVKCVFRFGIIMFMSRNGF